MKGVKRGAGVHRNRPCLGGCGRIVDTPRCRSCYRAKAAAPLTPMLSPIDFGSARFWLPQEVRA